MDTKEKVIKEAWGVIWFLFDKQEKEAVIKNNGYYKGSNDDIFEAIDQNEHLFDFIAEKGSIPYSLEGIDDNNGWISINSQEDLPKEFQEYHVIRDNFFQTAHYVSKDRWIYPGNDYPKTTNTLKITHYQPIIKPKLPLHK